MADCACFVLWDQDRQLVLMENRPYFRSEPGPYYVFPGGKHEPGETAEQAMIRECIEETGCAPLEYQEIESPVELRSRFNRNSADADFQGWHVRAFLVTKWDGTPPSSTLDHGAQLRWMDLSSVSSLPDGNTCVGEIVGLVRVLVA